MVSVDPDQNVNTLADLQLSVSMLCLSDFYLDELKYPNRVAQL